MPEIRKPLNDSDIKWLEDFQGTRIMLFKFNFDYEINGILFLAKNKGKSIFKLKINDLVEWDYIKEKEPTDFQNWIMFKYFRNDVENVSIKNFIRYIKNIEKINLQNNFYEAKILVINRISSSLLIGDQLFLTNRSQNVRNGTYLNYIFYKIPIEFINEIIDNLEEENILRVTKITRQRNRANWADTYEIKRYYLTSKALSQISQNQVFLISEFNNEDKNFDDLNLAIKKALAEKGIPTIIMNIDHQHGNINLAIKKYIKDSRWIIANLNYKKNRTWNPNVFYEIGMAHAFNKDVIMFLDKDLFPGEKNNGNEIENNLNFPFDISSHTCLTLYKREKLINEILKIIVPK